MIATTSYHHRDDDRRRRHNNKDNNNDDTDHLSYYYRPVHHHENHGETEDCCLPHAESIDARLVTATTTATPSSSTSPWKTIVKTMVRRRIGGRDQGKGPGRDEIGVIDEEASGTVIMDTEICCYTHHTNAQDGSSGSGNRMEEGKLCVDDGSPLWASSSSLVPPEMISSSSSSPTTSNSLLTISPPSSTTSSSLHKSSCTESPMVLTKDEGHDSLVKTKRTSTRKENSKDSLSDYRVHQNYSHSPPSSSLLLPPHPSRWPQSPLLVCATPGSGMIVRGVRYSSCSTYLPSSRRHLFHDEQKEEKKDGWRIPAAATNAPEALPINNGMESNGKCLVIDFETNWFIGTAMLRIRDTPPWPVSLSPSPNKRNSNVGENSSSGSDYEMLGRGGDALSGRLLHRRRSDRHNKKKNDCLTLSQCGSSERGASYYFTNRKRRFQAVIRGRFKVPNIPMNACVTGQYFETRPPPGYLPPKWVLRSAVSFVSLLSPQLQADLDGPKPKFLSPLVPTAQTVSGRKLIVKDDDDDVENVPHGCCGTSIENDMVEPCDETSLLLDLEPRLSYHPRILTKLKSHDETWRVKERKSAFNKNYSSFNNTNNDPKTKKPTVLFRTDVEYTFEFFQHLLHFDDMSIDFGSILGKHELGGILRNQPLKFMAAYQQQNHHHSTRLSSPTSTNEKDPDLKRLWSFDIWHASMMH